MPVFLGQGLVHVPVAEDMLAFGVQGLGKEEEAHASAIGAIGHGA